MRGAKGKMSMATEKSVEFYDFVGQTEWNQSLHRTMVHWIGMTGHEEVLDVGCGAGRLLMQVAQRTKWVMGVDTSELMIRRAKVNADENDITNVTFQVANIRKLPFENQQFDLVICSDLLFLLDRPAIALKELIRVCKLDGQIIILNPSSGMNPWSAKNYCETHRLGEFDRDSLLAWATASARRTLPSEAQMAQLAEGCHGQLTDSVTVLDNLAALFRIVPNPQ